MIRTAGAAVVAAITAAAALTAAPAFAADDAVMKALAPTGKLRVAIAVGPAPSAIYSLEDANGNRRGVTIDLANALGKKLGVAIVFVPYLGSGDIQAAAATNAWDV